MEKCLYECAICGDITYIEKKTRLKKREDIYFDLHCSCCQKDTPHLYVGTDWIDYGLYDMFLDGRYFKYNTK